MKSDRDTIDYLKKLCFFKSKFNDDFCVELDLTHSDFVFTGTVRHHSIAQKKDILKTISKLQHLEKLNLRKNNFNDLDKLYFPLLKNLDIGSNCLSHVPLWLKDSPIEYLNLGANNIKELPIDIGKIKTLSHLAVFGEKIQTVPESFFDLNLQKLNISKNLLPAHLIDKITKKFEKLEFFEI